MKKQTFILLGIVFLLASCVVKSLEPFYTKKSISFDERLIGKWVDSKKGNWSIVSFKEEITENKPKKKLNKEEKLLFDIYKNSYYILREYKDKETMYIATPFTVKEERFLDFYPLDNQDGIDNLLERHSVYTHSLVKYAFNNDGKLSIKWLDEDKVEALFEEKKIKIEHRKIGILRDKYLLFASSEDLEKFIEKYISSNDSNKWDTDTKYTLSKVLE